MPENGRWDLIRRLNLMYLFDYILDMLLSINTFIQINDVSHISWVSLLMTGKNIR